MSISKNIYVGEYILIIKDPSFVAIIMFYLQRWSWVQKSICRLNLVRIHMYMKILFPIASNAKWIFSAALFLCLNIQNNFADNFSDMGRIYIKIFMFRSFPSNDWIRQTKRLLANILPKTAFITNYQNGNIAVQIYSYKTPKSWVLGAWFSPAIP